MPIDSPSLPLKHYFFEKLFFTVFIFALFLAPPLKLFHLPFYLHFSDLLLPVLFFFIVKNKWYLDIKLLYLLILLSFSGYILFTIFVNCRFKAVNDYFEIYFILKIIICFVFLKNIYNQKFTYKILNIIFVLLLLFNFFHYFNILHFNEKIMPYYCPDNNLNLIFFGRNSLGEIATKRMLGTMGNPNTNALLFIFFLIIYLPRKQWKPEQIIFFFLALIAVLACQSRTGFIIAGIVIGMNYLFYRTKIRTILVQLFSIILVSSVFLKMDEIMKFFNLSFYIGNNTYTYTLFGYEAFESRSWQARLETWENLLEMCKEKPLFGHSPNKNYFYENKIYSENEYILMLWRYGIIGLLFYLLFYIIPIKKACKLARSNLEAKNVILLGTGFLIAAITNNPLKDATLILIYFMMVAFFYASLLKNNA